MNSQKAAGGFVLALTAGLIVAACAAKQPSRSVSQFDEDKADIALMSSEIRQWRAEMGLGVEPPAETLLQYRHVPVKKLRLCPDEPAPNGEKCKDVCTLKDHICDNAENICRIAEDLDGDGWAIEKCNTAKASCKQATEKCCECATSEAEGQSSTGNACGG